MNRGSQSKNNRTKVMVVRMGSQILRDCVNCDMPLKKSNQIVLDTQGGQVNPQVRTHRIAIYSDPVLR